MEVTDFISEITAAMSRNDDPEVVLDQILSSCIQYSEADSGSIMILDSRREFLEIRAERGLSPSAAALRLRVGEGVTGWVARYGRSRNIGDTSQEADYISVKDGLSSELAVPMFVRDELIGVLSLDSHRKNAFNEEHEHFLVIMSDLAAHIFRNLDDNRLLKIRDRFHRVMIKISRVISRSLELEDVFREMMEITETSFRLFNSTLFLYDAASDSLKVAAASGSDRKGDESVVYQPGEGVTGSVFMNKTPLFIPDVKSEPDFQNRMNLFEDESDNVGFFCTPIFSGRDVVGVFSTCTRHQSGMAAEFLIEYLEILGSLISQAITIQKLVKEQTRVIESENIQLKRQLGSRYRFGNLIGGTPEMQRLFEQVQVIADSRASVLITGESGTGKELIASAIHYNSPRADAPLVKVNCAAIPENLLESELFGHRKGSFTGAVSDKKGKFEMAHGGTIFLDEIGELPLNLQSKLLRVLQEREIEPVGGKTKEVDIRILAATNALLPEKIEQGEFRSDLFYRLNVINLHVPPLRERKGDIIPLAQSFIEKICKEYKKNITGLSPAAAQLLESHDWPGNVRELENILERAIVLTANNILAVDDFQDATLPFAGQGVTEGENGEFKVATPVVSGAQGESLIVAELPDEEGLEARAGHVYHYVIGEVEKRLIKKALQKFRYKKTRAASFLGINRNTLDKKIKELQIEY